MTGCGKLTSYNDLLQASTFKAKLGCRVYDVWRKFNEHGTEGHTQQAVVKSFTVQPPLWISEASAASDRT